METFFNQYLSEKYKSPTQKARVLSENWAQSQVYCPNCGLSPIKKYQNCRPVADFYCSNCGEEFELKSKKGMFGLKIVDGAYSTMIERLCAKNNPNLFLLNYSWSTLEVLNLIVIPKHFFIPGIIEQRPALSNTARRAGWIGCNIILNKIPKSGRIHIIKNRVVEPKDVVLAGWQKTLFLCDEDQNTKGWLLDIMNCIDKLSQRKFTLADIYKFELELGIKHPSNHHIKEKIRQQLQVLRKKGYLEFTGSGTYRTT